MIYLLYSKPSEDIRFMILWETDWNLSHYSLIIISFSELLTAFSNLLHKLFSCFSTQSIMLNSHRKNKNKHSIRSSEKAHLQFKLLFKLIQIIRFLNNYKKENKKHHFSLVERFSGFSRWCTVWMSVCLRDIIFCCHEPSYNSVLFGWAIRAVHCFSWQANRLLFIVCTSSECSKGWIALFALVWEQLGGFNIYSAVCTVTGCFVKCHFIQDSASERDSVDSRLSLYWEN